MLNYHAKEYILYPIWIQYIFFFIFHSAFYKFQETILIFLQVIYVKTIKVIDDVEIYFDKIQKVKEMDVKNRIKATFCYENACETYFKVEGLTIT